MIIKPANKNRVFKRNTPLNPLLIEGKTEDIQIRGGTGTGKGGKAGIMHSPL
ncbi:hypothetical protein MNBD_NITROSPIRAE02-1448 [hydrothermal vent metagenome]|uniref:Uncharacterized protein n=1 Tax=hydrothermal vent metagenome TaxID=652676 RepID=A0A3B1D651_9ZZZZ